MPTPVDPYDFTNGTPADAEQVDARFKVLFDTLTRTAVGVDSANVKDGGLTYRSLKTPLAHATQSAVAYPLAHHVETDIPGLSLAVNLDVASTMLVAVCVTTFLAHTGLGSGDLCDLALLLDVDGVNDGLIFTRSNVDDYDADTQVGLWVLGLAAGAHTIKAQAYASVTGSAVAGVQRRDGGAEGIIVGLPFAT